MWLYTSLSNCYVIYCFSLLCACFIVSIMSCELVTQTHLNIFLLIFTVLIAEIIQLWNQNIKPERSCAVPALEISGSHLMQFMVLWCNCVYIISFLLKCQAWTLFLFLVFLRPGLMKCCVCFWVNVVGSFVFINLFTHCVFTLVSSSSAISFHSSLLLFVITINFRHSCMLRDGVFHLNLLFFPVYWISFLVRQLLC